METWRKQIERPVSRLEIGGFRPTGRPETSSFCHISLRLPDEKWPVWQGQPLIPLCQLNLTESFYVPENLRDLSLITIFIAENFYDEDPVSVRDRHDQSERLWCLRSYESIERLVPIIAPENSTTLLSFEARWRRTEIDYPTHDTMPIELPPEIDDNYYDIEGIETLDGTKLGGWPSCIQSEPWWDYREDGAEFEYALQVDSQENSGWMWGDLGAAYFARSKIEPSRWAFDWQCH